MIAFSTGLNFGDFAVEFKKKNIKTFHRPLQLGLKQFLAQYIYYRKFYKYLKSEKIDVLHIHRSDLYMVAVCAWLANVRVIKTVHSVFKHRKHTYLYGVSQRFIARKIFKVNYHSIGESVHKNESHYYHNRSIRINNWFDNKSFFPIKSIEEKHTLREKLEIKNDQFVIISVGSCSIIKNHSDIIRSVAHLNESINCTYIHLGIGEEEENEKKLANELGNF